MPQPVLLLKSEVTQKKLEQHQTRHIDKFGLESVEECDAKFLQFSNQFLKEISTPASTLANNSSTTTGGGKYDKRVSTVPQVQFNIASRSVGSLVPSDLNKTPKSMSNHKSNLLIRPLKLNFEDGNTSKSQIGLKSSDQQQSSLQQEVGAGVSNSPNHGVIRRGGKKRSYAKMKTVIINLPASPQTNNNNHSASAIKSNSAAEYLGNSLIVTVFQALIVKVIEEKFRIRINMENDLPISTNVLKMFDLSPIAISNIKGSEQKKDYIYSTMCKKIDELLDNFDDKIAARNQAAAKLNKEGEKSSSVPENTEQFGWLKLKNKNESLRKRLRQIIVEKLSDYENLILVEEAISKKKELNQSGKRDEASRTFSSLSFQPTTTKDIFKNMSTYGSHKIKQYLSRLGIQKYSQEVQVNRSAISAKNNSSFTSPPQDPIFTWQNGQEKEFQEQRSSKKYIYSNEVVSSSWNDVGFLPFVQRYIQEYKKTIHRDFLLERYAGGEQLSREEMQFLANTSELLNSCVDKKFMQNALNHINPDVLDNMELGIAESILCSYEEAKAAIRHGRQSYLQTKVDQQKEKSRIHTKNEQIAKDKENYKRFYRRYCKMIQSVVTCMEKQQKFDKKLPDEVAGSEFLNQFLLGQIDERESVQALVALSKLTELQFNEYMENKIQECEMENKNKNIKQAQLANYNESIKQKQFFESVRRHRYHPSSKVFIEKGNFDEIDEQKDITYLKSLLNKRNTFQREIKQYEITLKSPQVLRDPTHFKQFYTGGPPRKLSGSSILVTITPMYIAQPIITASPLLGTILEDRKEQSYVERIEQYYTNIEVLQNQLASQANVGDTQKWEKRATIHNGILSKKDTFNPAKPSIVDIQFNLIPRGSQTHIPTNTSQEHIKEQRADTAISIDHYDEYGDDTSKKINENSTKSKLNDDKHTMQRKLNSLNLSYMKAGMAEFKQKHEDRKKLELVQNAGLSRSKGTQKYILMHKSQDNSVDMFGFNRSKDTTQEPYEGDEITNATIDQEQNSKSSNLAVKSRSTSIRKMHTMFHKQPQLVVRPSKQQSFDKLIRQSTSPFGAMFSEVTSNVGEPFFSRNSKESLTEGISQALPPSTPRASMFASNPFDSIQQTTSSQPSPAIKPQMEQPVVSTIPLNIPSNITQLLAQKRLKTEDDSLIMTTIDLSSIPDDNSNENPASPLTSDQSSLLLSIKNNATKPQRNMTNLVEYEAQLNPKKLQPVLTSKQQRIFAAASSPDQPELLSSLKKSGFAFYDVDVNARNLETNTPLHIAVKTRNYPVINWLLSLKSNVNSRNKHGNTPVHIAFAKNDINLILTLIQHGADLNIANSRYHTPPGLATRSTLKAIGLKSAVLVSLDQLWYIRNFNNNSLICE